MVAETAHHVLARIVMIGAHHQRHLYKAPQGYGEPAGIRRPDDDIVKIAIGLAYDVEVVPARAGEGLFHLVAQPLHDIGVACRHAPCGLLRRIDFQLHPQLIDLVDRLPRPADHPRTMIGKIFDEAARREFLQRLSHGRAREARLLCERGFAQMFARRPASLKDSLADDIAHPVHRRLGGRVIVPLASARGRHARLSCLLFSSKEDADISSP